RLGLLEPAAQASACDAPDVANLIGLPSPVSTLEAERAAWETYADDDTRKVLAAAIVDEAEAARRGLVAHLAAEHWRWSQAVGNEAGRLNAAVKAAMGQIFAEDAQVEIAL